MLLLCDGLLALFLRLRGHGAENYQATDHETTDHNSDNLSRGATFLSSHLFNSARKKNRLFP